MNSNQIQKYRKEIDKIDTQILKLLNKRFQYSIIIGKIKMISGIPVFNKKRENEIIENLQKKTEKKDLSDTFIKSLFTMIFKESRKTQRALTKSQKTDKITR